jgi:hypothetical protein
MKQKTNPFTIAASFAVVLSMGVSLVQADYCGYRNDTCCDYDPCDESQYKYEVGADFLWWKSTYKPAHAGSYSTVENTDEVTLSNTTTEGSYIDPEFSPGVRVYLSSDACFCDFGLYASYTYLNASYKKTTLDAVNPSSTQGIVSFVIPSYMNSLYVVNGAIPINSITSHLDQTYQSFDLLIQKDYVVGRCGHLNAFAGLTGLDYDLDFKQSIVATETIGSVESIANTEVDVDPSFSGLGLRCGLDYTYTFCECWGINALASGAVYVGSYEATLNGVIDVTETGTLTQTKKDDQLIAVPELHLGISLTYDFNTCYGDGQLRIGYETLQWWGLPTIQRNNILTAAFKPEDYNGSTATLTDIVSRSEVIGFHGLILGGSFRF